MRGRAHHGVWARLGQGLGHGVDQRGRDEGLIALHVDDQRLVGQLQGLHGLGQAVAATGMVAAGGQAVDAVRGAGLSDAGVIGGDDHGLGLARQEL